MSFPPNHEAESSSSSYSPSSCREFTLREIQLATHNFDESRLLGSGGFAKVYRGTITYDGRRMDVAIKRLTTRRGFSDEEAKRFWYEVALLSKLRHPHLVSQIGYCSDGQEMIFVYDYLPRGTLEDRLHNGRLSLSWMRRLKICLDVARGLEYLHSEKDAKSKVLHLDVKSSNILLTSNWAAKISDFGLSKVRPVESTYLTDHVGGTLGYLDPDFQLTGEATRKTDVFAFGVVMFEVLCGKKAYPSIDGKRQFLKAWAQESIKKGRIKKIIDPNLEGRISPKCEKKFVVLADNCLHSHPLQRPTIAKVVKDLESIMALQEEADKASNEKHSAEDISLKSLDGYLYTIGEDQILHRFNFNTILQATENFSKANKVLDHTYDHWSYKGRLQNGQEIIVTSYSDARTYRECMDVASLLVKSEHENVIKLFGYCIDDTTVCLIYDFALNATLDRLIFDPSRRNVLDWSKRYKIIVGVARGLAYLHHHAHVPIIHGNVEPAYIALDESFDPKLWYFGHDLSGTWEYFAPEYFHLGRPTSKTDVFGFGVLILVILYREVSSDEVLRWKRGMIRYIRRNWLEGTLSNVGDPNVDSILTTKLIQIGLLCCRDSYEIRPTMEEVVGMLLGTLPLPFFSVLELDSWMIQDPYPDRVRVEDSGSDTGEV